MKQDVPLDKDFTTPLSGILGTDFLKEGNILNLLPAALYVCDAKGYIINYNKKAVELWGRTPEKGSKDERFCGAFKLYHVDGQYMPQHKTPVAACLEDGLPRKDLEVVIERPDLSQIIARINIVPIKDELGNIVGMVNCFYDITDEKKTQKKLYQKTKELEDYIENASIGLHWVDANGIIKWANKAELDMLGYSAGEYIGHHISEFHVDQEKIKDILHRLSCKETLTNYETTIRCKDGSVRIVQINSNVYWDEGKFVHTRCFTVDVTELKESEKQLKELTSLLEKRIEERTSDLKTKNEELQRSEERYHKMIDEVEDYAIILLDKDGIVQNWNKGAEKIKGYKEKEIVGKSFSEFYLREDREKGLHQILLTQAKEKGKAIHEGWRRRKDGTAFWGSIVLTSLHDDQNNVVGFSKVTRDLTERKLAEDKLREYTSELEFQNKELEQFAYAASHDMKEPLRKIHFYNSFIVENNNNQLDDKSKEYLHRSLAAVKRMTGLIEDLLTYSKSTSSVESFEDVDVNKIVQEIILLHKEEIEQKNIQTEVGDLPVVHSVPFQFKQLMDNLINNSIKYNHPERNTVIRITSETIKGADINEKDAEAEAMYHKISVIDNGVGFEPHYSDKIFEIFQRLTNQSAARGSGIGLAICKKIVQNHKGFIKALGRPNEGARFDIYIPAGL